MGESGGGSTLAQHLFELQEALGDYFGVINEIKLGLEVAIPEKPEALILYDQIKEFGIPLVDGGILDQPWMFMQEYKIVDDVKRQMELIEHLNAKSTPHPGEDPYGT